MADKITESVKPRTFEDMIKGFMHLKDAVHKVSNIEKNRRPLVRLSKDAWDKMLKDSKNRAAKHKNQKAARRMNRGR